jgi:hypothetical protein
MMKKEIKCFLKLRKSTITKHMLRTILSCWVILIVSPGNAQTYKPNFGLQQPQDPATLPVSKAKPQMAIRKAKSDVVPTLQKLADNEYLISSGWEMAEGNQLIASGGSLFSPDFNTSGWYNATVPGTVLTTLVDQGVYPDPYYGLNNLLIPDSLCRKDWWYRIELPLPENRQNKLIWVLFNGINYKADIWLNGKLLGRMEGAFIRGNFDATRLINPDGKNILAVHIYPPLNPGIPHEESSKTNAGPNGGQLCMDGPTFISSEGWDWVPGIHDRNIGIWQDVRLLLTDVVTISDPQVITDLQLPDTTKVAITVKTWLKNHSGIAQQTVVSGNIGKVEFSKIVDLKPGESRLIVFAPDEYTQLNVLNSGLWWPNGYGRQELHTLHLKANLGNTLSDRAEIRFGIREFSYELAVAQPENRIWRVEFNPVSTAGEVLFNTIDRVDVGKGTFLPKLAEGVNPALLTTIEKESTNPFLTIKVNGVPVFCKGGNWGMDDGMKRVSRERLEPYFRLHRDAGFNMVRNWTGESTEELFYSLCDEYGMMVWNDFWLSTEGYNLNVNDNDLFMANATDVVKRFRNHPSIAVWCPRNEGYAPVQIEPRLQELIAGEDGTRYYSPNSRNMNLRPSGPWNYLKDPAEYYRNIAEGFNSELGTPSVPTAATLRSFMPVEDQWPIGDTWYYHDFHDGQKDYVATLEKRYGAAGSLDDFCCKAQQLNYDSHHAMFESWNSKMWNKASGILLWMTHPAWPSMVWQTYSSDYETFGSYFGSKKACEPVHIQMNLHDKKVVVLNTTLRKYSQLKAQMEVYDLYGKKLHSQTAMIDVVANSLTPCFVAELPQELPPVCLVRLTLSDRNLVYSLNDYWQSRSGSFDEFNRLPAVRIEGKVLTKTSSEASFQLFNKGKTPVIALKFNLTEAGSGKIVLPAYFSEGYINLLPGEKRTVKVNYLKGNLNGLHLVCEGYNLAFQKLTEL